MSHNSLLRRERERERGGERERERETDRCMAERETEAFSVGAPSLFVVPFTLLHPSDSTFEKDPTT
jgi:hypothetical protein